MTTRKLMIAFQIQNHAIVSETNAISISYFFNLFIALCAAKMYHFNGNLLA